MKLMLKIFGLFFLVATITELTSKEIPSSILMSTLSVICLYFGFKKSKRNEIAIDIKRPNSRDRDIHKTEQELNDDYYCFLLKIIMYNYNQLRELGNLPHVDSKVNELLKRLTE